DTRSDALIVTLATKEENNAQTIRLMQLKGKWQASVHNRLIFVIQRSGTVRDVLIFEGAWEINDTHTLTYTYEKAYGVRAVRIKKTISFKGFWQIWEKNRLSYILDIRKDSYFNFKVAFQTPSILAKKGEIRYRVGIGVRGSRSFREKTFILYGTWNVSRDFGFSFEIDYGKSRLTRMHFGARVRSAGKNEIEFQLTTREGNDIGFAVMVSRRFLSNNAQWFVRLMKRAQETALQGGVLVRF
ncbi:MAG: hypothetical protein KKF80_04140, partial [Candidatus Omnitrophica bacterium]|nr:hypothetical protein [Candidatus Omnitrophota bacterium]